MVKIELDAEEAIIEESQEIAAAVDDRGVDKGVGVQDAAVQLLSVLFLGSLKVSGFAHHVKDSPALKESFGQLVEIDSDPAGNAAAPNTALFNSTYISPFSGNPLDPSYSLNVPCFCSPVFFAMSPAQPLLDGQSWLFEVSVLDYLYDQIQQSSFHSNQPNNIPTGTAPTNRVLSTIISLDTAAPINVTTVFGPLTAVNNLNNTNFDYSSSSILWPTAPAALTCPPAKEPDKKLSKTTTPKQSGHKYAATAKKPASMDENKA
ncbi:hypothetical protein EST38_g13628 [Candolleomyces aberdarensis]|uniref:Uncharacterized protein n=1 Tax=Candolleomyces aberdarensis TaxID=2316362 RepID=A0A4Q2D259_9AGAR|nr:hypothetical protein EST38_g13628 [Candolleomyces aberdarensis]